MPAPNEGRTSLHTSGTPGILGGLPLVGADPIRLSNTGTCPPSKQLARPRDVRARALGVPAEPEPPPGLADDEPQQRMSQMVQVPDSGGGSAQRWWWYGIVESRF